MSPSANVSLLDPETKKEQELGGPAQTSLLFQQSRPSSSHDVAEGSIATAPSLEFTASLTQSTFPCKRPVVELCQGYRDLISNGELSALNINSMLQNESNPTEQRKLVLAVNIRTFETSWREMKSKRQLILKNIRNRTERNTDGNPKEKPLYVQNKDAINITAFWNAVDSTQLYFFDLNCTCSHGISGTLEDTLVTLKAGTTIDGKVCAKQAHSVSASPILRHVKS